MLKDNLSGSVKYFFAVLMICISFTTNGQQSAQDLLQSAAYWEKQGDLQSAAYLYQEYIAKNPDAAIGIYYKTASLMQELFHYTQAQIYFKKVVDSDSLDYYPQALFWLGMSLKNKGLYDDALNYFQRYNKEYTAKESNIMQRRVLVETDACTFAMNAVLDTSNVKITRLPAIINTSYSEYNAVQYANEAIFFASIRPVAKSEYNTVFDDYYMSKIYFTPYRVNGLEDVIPLPAHINNPKFNNGNFCFDSTYAKLYFSRCPINKKRNKYCSIWISELKNGKWGLPHKLDKTINQPYSSSIQPNIVNANGIEILYFISDKEGGLGGNDIWYSILSEGRFAEPVNLGNRINTPGNEVTPFYDNKTQRLYFSSDWHKGFGGYDIFYSEGLLGAWGDVINMGLPFNSPANDMFFTVNNDDNDGFLTSNRDGSYYFDTENCCTDVYEYEWLKKGLIIKRDTFFIQDVSTMLRTVDEFSPITLYFHNDEPDPKTLNTTTTKDYETTLKEYSAMKDLYKEEYSKGLTGEEKIRAINQIDTFFTETVEKGFEHLNQFIQWLLADLNRGNNVYVHIIGSASPLYSEEYNKNLSSRRISSLINYIRKQPEFQPYLDTITPTNKLYFIEEPTGKKYAANYVSSNPNDVRNSIYSIAAALERKIQITASVSEKDTVNERAIFTFPNTPIIVQQKKNVDLYEMYIEIENSGNKNLYIFGIEIDNKAIDKRISAILRASEKKHIKLSFPSTVFKESKEAKIRIITDENIEEIQIQFQPINK